MPQGGPGFPNRIGSDSQESWSEGKASSSLAHTVSGLAPNRVLVAYFAFLDDGDSVNSFPTWNGSNLTQLRRSVRVGTDRGAVEIWYLVDPDVGSYTLEATYTGSPGAGALLVCTYADTDQSNPFPQDAGTNNFTASFSRSMTVSAESLYVTWIFGDEGNSLYTPGDDAVEIYEISTGANALLDGVAQLAESQHAASETATHSATFDTRHWAIIDFEIAHKARPALTPTEHNYPITSRESPRQPLRLWPKID